ncbi:hypothetical protein [Thermophagus xiamenensis]|uniref:hypothetical protein n=1 Tax=Thermophagus xiamenensis TaxID=385682 RepID=UPI001110CC09|nr:hypothetical protein [Thermophagus xiamenensis]
MKLSPTNIPPARCITECHTYGIDWNPTYPYYHNYLPATSKRADLSVFLQQQDWAPSEATFWYNPD